MMSFRLRPESEMRFHLPFYFAPGSPAESVSEETVRDANLQLVLSFYPEQRQILIDETEQIVRYDENGSDIDTNMRKIYNVK